MFKSFRRVRSNSVLRDMVRETSLSIEDFIYPLFVIDGENIKNEVASMPGVYQMSLDNILKECKELESLGIRAIMLFGIPTIKDSIGSDALNDDGLIARSLRTIKKEFPKMFVSADLCFCEYTDHGHCGILDGESVDNDKTLDILVRQALIHAKSGVDLIAPSGMMDGVIEVLRKALDENGFENLPIMSYSTKFASSFYGPFRDVAQSSPSSGDRKAYQMDPANRLEAIAESLEDDRQGADILMVKPALAYLDIVREIKQKTSLPLAVYNVSGEYAMLKSAAKMGVIDYEKVLIETMISFKRAGADIIISYHTKEIAKMLKNR
jgi:porphobilinogen synthase